MLAALKASREPGLAAEQEGDAGSAFTAAAHVVEAEYQAPYLAHGQLEPPSSIARFNGDGTLDLWLPNQMPELFQAVAAKIAGVQPDQVTIHTPMLGGFFGRHFMYGPSNPFPQAILLAKATNRSSAVEGIVEKPYAIPHRRMEYVKVAHPVNIAFWRSVGHSMNDFFYEGFLDELAAASNQDPFALRLALLRDKPRHTALLQAVAELSGGWKRGPYDAEGGKRARGIAMASPFGSETATIAEVSVSDGDVRVHTLWIAIDPGNVVNPALVAAQVESAAALGLSSALVEQVVYRDGQRQAQNYDTYPILRRENMPAVHVRIVESGAPMGGVGEPGLPGMPPAVVNAMAALTGQRIRSLPLANVKLSGV
jgi:CO/xanthine dehydrogenase Mo-binding subunit